jgi:hypothetical protein
MPKISAVTIKGKSGNEYAFDVWALDQAFNPVAAVYAVTRRYQNAALTYSHDVIYIGETEDLSTRFNGHHNADCFKKHKANCICTHRDGDSDSRLEKEDDLIQLHNPVCNG